MSATLDLTAIKSHMKACWEAGDYATFSRYMEPGAVDLLRAWNVQPRQRLLDVGCGAGQLAIPAARMGLDATGVDIASNLVESARERAKAEGLDARFDEGDAEALPYEDDSFDVVASIFGAMFAPQPEKVAAELQRVCRPGGRILMGNWTPTSFPANVFRTLARHITPADVPSPLLWGDESVVRQRFDGAGEVKAQKRLYSKWAYPFPPAELVDFFGQYFGPLVQANEKLDESQREALRRDLVEVFQEFDRGGNGTTLLEGEFLSVDVAC